MILAPGQAAYVRLTGSPCGAGTASTRSIRLIIPGSTRPLTVGLGSGSAFSSCNAAQAPAVAVSSFKQSLADLRSS